MPSRRQFIRAGLALSVAPAVIPIQETANLPPTIELVSPTYRRLCCIVCDVRSHWSNDVAREAERLGVGVVRTSGDITDFWFNDLSQRWREAPVAIGGLTAYGPLFCLERFGWDHGLRVVFRGTHRFLDARQIEHVISGPTCTIAAVNHARLGNADWACQVAHLINSCAATRDTTSIKVRGVVSSDCHDDVHEPLVSWVIAPKRV